MAYVFMGVYLAGGVQRVGWWERVLGIQSINILQLYWAITMLYTYLLGLYLYVLVLL
jgi:hypothetical protein